MSCFDPLFTVKNCKKYCFTVDKSTGWSFSRRLSNLLINMVHAVLTFWWIVDRLGPNGHNKTPTVSNRSGVGEHNKLTSVSCRFNSTNTPSWSDGSRCSYNRPKRLSQREVYRNMDGGFASTETNPGSPRVSPTPGLVDHWPRLAHFVFWLKQ